MLNGKKILSVCGAVALLLGVGMNLRHSLNDYGMGTNSLSTFALAQSGWFWTLKETETECTYSSSPISGSMSITLPDGSSVSGSISGGDVITFKGVLWDCKDGWNPFCTKDCRAAK